MSTFHPHALDRRVGAARTILWGTACVFAVAFFRIQILGHDRYQLQSETNRLRPIPLPAPRGVITDRNGRVLAENVPGYTVSLLPAPEAALRDALERIAPIAGLQRGAIEGVLARYRRAPYQPVLVLADAPFDVVSRLEERRVMIPGLVVQTEPKRFYPDSSVAAHLIGYVSEISEAERSQRRWAGVRLGGLIGKDGVEREYDDTLRGKDGVRFVEVSAVGHMVRQPGEEQTLPPVRGAPLHTTLDLELQRYVAQIFPEGQRGAVLAINPNTGEVLALYSAPGFDPNAFVGGVRPEYWRTLAESEATPLLDRAIQARYPPGSVWKLAIAAMALKRGIVTARSRMPMPCRGGYHYGNRFFRCWRAEGHGSLTLTEAIAHSCDVYFYQLGLKLTLDGLLDDAKAWGFHSRTGIDLPGEIPPEFPTGSEYYDRLYGPNRWTRAVTLNLAIGQGENAQTLISMVRLFQMLATDGRARTPYLVKPTGRAAAVLELGADQLSVLRQAMVSVVERGTARASRIGLVTIAGKTGTSQNPHGPDHGWFVGFAPADKPEILVGAVVEYARHGSAVAPLVARIIARYLGADSVAAPEFQFALPSDSAPESIQVMPTLPRPDTTLRILPPRDTIRAPRDTLRAPPPPPAR